MEDDVTLEPIEDGDLDAIAALTAQAWYAPVDEAALLQATDETCAYLADMTWGIKAVVGGQVAGVIITHGTHDDPEAARRWERIGAAAREQAAKMAGEQDEPAYLDEIRATEEMRDEAGLEGEPRVLLLVLGEAARGHGTGRRLLDQARDHFARHGAERYWLVTDTDCDWPFYEHLGLSRLAEREGQVEGAPERYFVYGGSTR